MRKVYQARFQRFREVREQEKSLGIRLGWARAVVFPVGFLCYLGMDLGIGGQPRAWGMGMGLASLLFIGLVLWHRTVRRRRRWFQTMAGINETALARVARNWDALPPVPFDPPDSQHLYALDLDVCGRASLFRLFTSVTLPPGFEKLRSWLLEPASPDEVVRRQEAVAELSPMLDFRQEFEAKGRLLENPPPDAIRGFLDWAESDGWLSGHPGVLWVARLIPLLTVVLFTLYWRGFLEAPWWLLSLGAGFGIGSFYRAQIHSLMDSASGGQDRFGRYSSTLGALLKTDVEAQVLREIQSAVRSSPVGAERELRRLERGVGWADVRRSPMAHAPLQALFVWDIHILGRLERWKAQSGPHVRSWLKALGEFEALSALATLHSDHPDWCFPKVSGERERGLAATGLGHPLLPSDVCIRNEVEIGPPGTFMFVTGSNMSGKSTLLRAIGLNAVLSQAGGPVCAESMSLSPLRVLTGMRTADSLADGVSQYMAELNRIRQVVDAARIEASQAALFLLDEPLQGTNEAERRVAVQTILGHLLDAKSVGAVATHDLQLDETDRLRSAARAIHLEGTVREGEGGPLLNFDYIVKAGRATSTNALALLRAVGLGRGEELE